MNKLYKQLADGHSLSEIPEDDHTFPICIFAVDINPDNIHHINLNIFETIEFVLLLETAFLSSRRQGNENNNFEFIPDPTLYGNYEEAIKIKPQIYQYFSIPDVIIESDDYRSFIYDISLCAVKNDADNYDFVPEDFRDDYNICEAAIINKPAIIDDIYSTNDNYEELCKIAVDQDLSTIVLISDKNVRDNILNSLNKDDRKKCIELLTY